MSPASPQPRPTHLGRDATPRRRPLGRTGHSARRGLALGLLALGLGACGGVDEGDPSDAPLEHDDQPILNGTPPSAALGTMPEQLGAVRVESPTGACTGTFLSNHWVITAKRCFQNMEVTQPWTVTLTMGTQSGVAAELALHPTLDVALVRVAAPFTVAGLASGFERRLYPAWRTELNGQSVLCYGFGRVSLSSIGTAFRTAQLTVDPATGIFGTVVLGNAAGQVPYLGDWGGGCLVQRPSGERVLIGVTSGNLYGTSSAILVSADAIRTWVTATRARYQLVAKHSGRCLDLLDYSTANDARFVQYDCYGGANQTLRVFQIDGNDVELRPSHVSHKCLEPEGWSTARGTRAVQFACDGSTAQRWELWHRGDGWLSLRNRATGQCLDVASASTANWAALQTWDCLDGDNQRFRLDMKVDSALESISQGDTWCVETEGASSSAGARGAVSRCSGQPHQRWRVSGDYVSTLQPAHVTGLCLEAPRSLADGERLVQTTCNGSARQQWRTQRVDGYGGAMIRSLGNDRCLGPWGSAAVQNTCGGWQTWHLY